MRRRLFWRVYLHGVSLLVAVALCMGLFHWVSGRRNPWPGIQQRAAGMLAEDLVDPTRLQTRVDDLSHILPSQTGVYAADGSPLALSTPPPDPLSDEVRAELADGDIHRPAEGYVAKRIAADGTYVVSRWPARPGSGWPLVLAGILAVLALVSIPLVRGLVGPLEVLTGVAERLGQGDLDARAGLKRQDEFGKLSEAIDEMAGRLQQSLRAERELLANVSHELRTPLARLRVALELMEELDDAPAELVGLRADLAELENLVEDVLAAGRLDRPGEMAVRSSSIEWRAFANEAIGRFAERHPAIALELSVSAEDSLGDPKLLRRVVDNLLANGVRHANGQGLALTISGSPESTQIEVSDTGPGALAESLEELFEPFYRGDASRHGPGVGLGLTLCRKIVDAHGGTITAAPNAPHGLRVTVSLPA